MNVLICIEDNKNVLCSSVVECARAMKCLKTGKRWFGEEKGHYQAEVPFANHKDSIGE